MEDIIRKIKDHPQFILADSDDDIISIIDEVNPGLTQNQKFELINALEKLGRSGSRKGQDFTIDGIKNTAKAFKSASSGETKQNIKSAVKQNDQRVEQNRRDSLTQDQRDAEDNLKAAQDRIRKEKNDAEVDRLYDQMKGSRKGSTVQQIIEAFDRDDVPHGELIRMAKELPDGLGDRVLIGLGAGSWRGDTPEEEEFFRIIDSKRSRSGSSVRKGTGPLCDLGSVSGKGSRPENLGSIASKIAIGRKRSINMDGEYVDKESREGAVYNIPFSYEDWEAQEAHIAMDIAKGIGRMDLAEKIFDIRSVTDEDKIKSYVESWGVDYNKFDDVVDSVLQG